jgi:hypothetical protein
VCALEPRRDILQAGAQRGQIRHDDADGAVDKLRLAGRHVDLAAANVDPHVVDTDYQIGIAREAHADQIEQRIHALIGLA